MYEVGDDRDVDVAGHDVGDVAVVSGADAKAWMVSIAMESIRWQTEPMLGASSRGHHDSRVADTVTSHVDDGGVVSLMIFVLLKSLHGRLCRLPGCRVCRFRPTSAANP